MATAKICTKCGEDKPLDAFSPLKTGRFGRTSACRVCMAKASREYAARNKEQVAERKKAYRATEEGRAKTAAYNERYAAENAERLKEYAARRWAESTPEQRARWAQQDREHRARHRDEINERRRERIRTDADLRQKNIERAREWYEQNKAVVAEQHREMYLANRERIKARVAAYQRANPEATRLLHRIKVNRRRARLREAGGDYGREDIERLYRLQKGKCANCRASLKKGFHIDHRMPVKLGGTNDPGNLELLCPACNLAKSAKRPEVFARENGRLL